MWINGPHWICMYVLQFNSRVRYWLRMSEVIQPFKGKVNKKLKVDTKVNHFVDWFEPQKIILIQVKTLIIFFFQTITWNQTERYWIHSFAHFLIFHISFGFYIFWPRASLKRHVLSKCASGAEKLVPLMLLYLYLQNIYYATCNNSIQEIYNFSYSDSAKIYKNRHSLTIKYLSLKWKQECA